MTNTARDPVRVTVALAPLEGDAMSTPDPRHPTERERDQHVWRTLFGGHSPREEVRWSAEGATAEDVAAAAWAQYAATWDDLDEDTIIASLTRTLRYEGGAR